MASFAHTLRTFHNGELSLEALLDEVEQILADGRADPKWMLATLKEDNALSSQAREAVQKRIESAAQSKGKRPRLTDDPRRRGSARLDSDGTRLATAYQLANSDQRATEEMPVVVARDHERIKGTGDTLNNRFELLECLGSGGMSTVYKALDRRKLEADDRNPYIAVKILNLEFRSHPDSLIALQREAKKCQSLSHPNIVRVYDFDRDGLTVYMTMEYLSGEPLGSKISAPGFKGMPAKEALRIINDMGKALRFAHDFGIVHADFKPANIFITDEGRVKVIDFGIARAFQRADDTAMEATRFDPRSLGALTPTYASPEMLEHQVPAPSDDIYGLACTAYEMLTGQHPYGRTQATAARDGGLKAKRHKALRRGQWRALRNALEFEREKRTSTVEQFLKEINAKVAPADRAAILAGSAGALMLLAAGAVYHFSRMDSATARIASEGAKQPPAPSSLTQPQRPPLSAPAVTPEPELGELPLTTITPLLRRLPCSALQASVNDGTVEIKGYARKNDLAHLRHDLSALTGTNKVDASQVTEIDGDKCKLVELLAPYWFTNKQFGHGTMIRTPDARDKLVEGENLILDLQTPSYASYVSVDYFSLDGGVLHMVPSLSFRSNQAPANHKATIGDLGEWSVAGPFGAEIIAILATPEPLFDGLRNEYESQAKYLPELKQRLAQLEKRLGDGQITADFVVITTSKRP